MVSMLPAWQGYSMCITDGRQALHSYRCLYTALACFLSRTSLARCAGNLHTAELLRWERYSYLMEPGNAGAFDNLFDRGPVINCIQFWGSWGAIDWGPVYHERWQVRLDCAPYES